MATSSIFHNVIITEKADAERFAEALEKAEEQAEKVAADAKQLKIT